MVDEAHERSLSTDLLLGLLRKVVVQRPDLRILISSASLEVSGGFSLPFPAMPCCMGNLLLFAEPKIMALPDTSNQPGCHRRSPEEQV